MQFDSPPKPHGDEPLHIQLRAPSVLESRGYFAAKTKTEMRLTPGFLLLWLAGIGVYFAFVRASIGSDRVGTLGLAIIIALGTVAGASWAGTALIIGRVLRRASLPTEPAQWLLVVLALRFLVELLLPAGSSNALQSKNAILYALMSWSLLFPTLLAKLPAAWRALYCMLVVVQVSSLFLDGLAWLDVPIETTSTFLDWIRMILMPSLPIGLTVAMRFRAVHYGWFHWLGVFTWLMCHLLHVSVLTVLS